MTFAKFASIVNEKRPDIFKVYEHKHFETTKGSQKSIHAAVIYTDGGKVYVFNGTYCEVLNKLGIKAVYKHDVESAKATLDRLVAENGKINPFFGEVVDNSELIMRYSALIEDYAKNYIIV